MTISHAKVHGTVRDCSDDTTIFLLTVGDEAHRSDCLKALMEQTIGFHLVTIERVAPLSAALQTMLDLCRTPYFIEVDEDMLLYPYAVERLISKISNCSQSCALVCMPLLDKLTDSPVYGIKAYRHDLAKTRSFPDRDNADWLHYLSLKASGYECIFESLMDEDNCLGVHAPYFTALSAFERWRGLFHKHRRYRHMDWIYGWPMQFMNKFEQTHDERYFWAFLGAMIGSIEDLPTNTEKSYNDSLDQFHHLKHLINAKRLSKNHP